MSDDELGFAILGGIFVLAVLAAIIAKVKGRSGFGWFIATLVFPPLFLLVLLLPAVHRNRAPDEAAANMPSWTQPADEAAEPGQDLQQALRRVSDNVDSDVGKRLLGLAARAARRARDKAERYDRAEQPDKEADPMPTVRTVSVQSRQFRHGAVRRTGSRETRIYRRT